MIKKPRIIILATGGTIAGKGESKTAVAGYEAGAFKIEDLIEGVPQLVDIAEVSGEQIANIDSQDMNETVWFDLTKRINEIFKNNEADGIVVTHGTDTMEETAFFAQLTVNSDKPVVFTGAMRPATALSADGPINLYNSVLVAGCSESIGKGVLAVMNDDICDAHSLRKTNTSHVDSFKALNTGLIGYIQNGTIRYYKELTKRHTKTSMVHLDPGINALPRVPIIYCYAGVDGELVEYYINQGVKGLIIAGMGNGGLGKLLTKALLEARKKGIQVVRSTRVYTGLITHNGDSKDDEYEFISADGFNPQKSRVLLQLALLKTNNHKEIQTIFNDH